MRSERDGILTIKHLTDVCVMVPRETNPRIFGKHGAIRSQNFEKPIGFVMTAPIHLAVQVDWLELWASMRISTVKDTPSKS